MCIGARRSNSGRMDMTHAGRPSAMRPLRFDPRNMALWRNVIIIPILLPLIPFLPWLRISQSGAASPRSTLLYLRCRRRLGCRRLRVPAPFTATPRFNADQAVWLTGCGRRNEPSWPRVMGPRRLPASFPPFRSSYLNQRGVQALFAI